MSTMDKDEDMSGSEPGNSSTRSTSAQSNKRKPPCCTRCKNHGLIILLKEHKRYCQHRYCCCKRCELTIERQKVQAKQTALKRAIDMDRRKKILSVEQTEPTPYNVELLLNSIEKKKSKKQKAFVSENNFEILLRYSLERMRYFSFAQPFLFSSTLLSIILEYAQRPKEDANEAAYLHISQVISEMVKIRWEYYLPILPSPLETPTYEGQLYPIRIGIPQNSFQPITRPLNTSGTLSTPPCSDNPPPETSPAPYHCGFVYGGGNAQPPVQPPFSSSFATCHVLGA